MGADVYFFVREKVVLPQELQEFKRQVSYDESEKESCLYYRDPYNIYNLAWIKGLPYWNLAVDEPLESALRFFEEVASVTEKEIEEYYERKVRCELMQTRKHAEELRKENPTLLKILSLEEMLSMTEEDMKRSYVEYMLRKRNYLRFILSLSPHDVVASV